MISQNEKIAGCLMGGAIGDAFGAPLEGIRTLKEIQNQFGRAGLQEFTPYKSFWDDAEADGFGVITDDTTMTACTMAGIIEAKKEGQDNLEERILDLQWQYYLVWGSHQDHGARLVDYIKPETKVPETMTPFMFRCGAGKGTIAALLQGKRGDVDVPVTYDMVIGGKRMISPNAGCGGIMRIAPISFLHDEFDTFQLAKRNAAITHSDPKAVETTATIAMLMSHCLKNDTLLSALQETKQEMLSRITEPSVIKAWNFAEYTAANAAYDMQTMNNLGYAFGKNPFMAMPVFTQIVYCAYSASEKTNPQSDDVKDVMRLAVNHEGDSDSVGAVVGNILGAAWGQASLPKDWVEILPLNKAVTALTNQYSALTKNTGPN